MIYKHSVSRPRKIFFILFFLLFLFAGLRVGFGPDYYSYYEIYESLNSNPFYEFYDQYSVFPAVEFGFRFFSATLKALGLDYRSYLLVMAFVILVPIYKSIIIVRGSDFLALFIFFCFFYLMWASSGIRQGVSISLVLYFFILLSSNRHNYSSFLLIVFAIMFHYSALVAIPMYFLFRLNVNLKYFHFILFLFFIFSFIFREFGMDLIIHSFLGLRVSFYIPNGSLSFHDFSFIWRFLLFLVVYFLFLLKFSVMSLFHRRIVIGFLFCFPVYIALSFVEILASQVSIYLFVFYIFVPSIFLSYFKTPELKNIILFLFLMSSIIYFTSLSSYFFAASKINEVDYIDDLDSGFAL